MQAEAFTIYWSEKMNSKRAKFNSIQSVGGDGKQKPKPGSDKSKKPAQK